MYFLIYNQELPFFLWPLSTSTKMQQWSPLTKTTLLSNWILWLGRWHSDICASLTTIQTFYIELQVLNHDRLTQLLFDIFSINCLIFFLNFDFIVFYRLLCLFLDICSNSDTYLEWKLVQQNELGRGINSC